MQYPGATLQSTPWYDVFTSWNNVSREPDDLSRRCAQNGRNATEQLTFVGPDTEGTETTSQALRVVCRW